MTSQITKDFKMKSRLRALADGGSPRPEMLGTGAAARAGGLLAGRGRQIDDAVDAATGAPAPAPAPAPVPAPQQVAQAPKKSGLRSMLGLADGGSYLDAGYNANRYQQSQLKDGGRVKGPGGRTDDKVGPVMLSDEEYVLPGDTADAIGRDKLDAIRLATHEFKDERKESALRSRADDAPVDHLADGGNPWTVDSEGVARKANSFGDAAAGPGYQQPRLPPPQPGTAVGPARVPPMGQRPPIDMGMVDEVPRQSLRPPTSTTPGTAPWSGPPPVNGNVGPGGSKEAQMFRNAAGNSFGDAAAASANTGLSSKAGSALRTAGNVLAKGAGVVGAGLAAKDMYDNGMNVGNTGDLLASGAALAGPVGVAGAAGWGVGRTIGNSLSEDTRDMIGGVVNQGVRNVGSLFGQDWGVDDSALLQQKAADRQAGANTPAAAPAAAAPAAPTLRSDQGAELPVQPGSYQSRRLSQMGVPEDVQNSAPIVDSALRGTQGILKTGGTSQFQNLGTYGGNANIYGRSSDPSRPGRINEFVGVGAGASPANEASGSGTGGGAIRSTAASALRGYGGETAQPAPQSTQPMANSRSAAADDINARYDRLLKGGRGKAVEFGSDWSQRHGIELEKARGDELSSVLNNENTNATSRGNAELHAETARRNADLNARVQMADAVGRMEQNRASLSQQAQAAQLKYLQDAQKTAREGEEKGFDRYTGAIGSMFTITDKDGKQTVDKAAQERFRSFVEGSDPQAGQKFAAMSPQQQQVLLQNFKTMYDMNEARNKTAQSGSWPSNTGGVTNRMDMPVDVREATFNDYWNNNLPLKDYVWSNLPGTNRNVVVTESGQPTLYSDYTSTGGERDLDKEKIVRDSVGARSKLRSN